MKMLKNKLTLLSPLIAIAALFLFSLTLFPSVQAQPRNLPIAIANEDQGVEIPNQPKMNMGQTIVDMVKQATSSTTDETPAVKWMEVGTLEEIQQGLDNRAYYAALIIPSDFSAKQASLLTPAPTSPELQIYINQGMNSAASTIAGQILNGIADNINNHVRTQIIGELTAREAALSAQQLSSLAAPVAKKIINVNEIGTRSANGNAPISLFQPLWMACIATAAILFIAANKAVIHTRKENLTAKAIQIAIGAVIALFVGFGLTWLSADMVGLHVPQFTDTALFLAITFFSFFLMISAVLSLVGIKGIGIFALMLFFGAPLLALAPEMMSPFYQDWVYSWLPMRFMVDGLRELFFFGHGLSWNTAVSTLAGIGLASALIILAAAFKPLARREQAKMTG